MISAISIRNLSHRYGDVEVLSDFNLEIASGEFVAVVGPSGCGKSTVLRVLAGLLRPTAGEVEVGSSSVVGNPGRVAYMPQKDLLLPWRRAFDNALLGAQVAGVDATEAERRARDLFAHFGLDGFEQAWPHELSGGMRQRVAVLRTILIPYPVLVLDEPFGALDAITRGAMQRWLEQVWMEDGRATLLVTHDIDEALLLADRVLVMTARPGHVELEVSTGWSRPRQGRLMTSAAFVENKARVMDALAL